MKMRVQKLLLQEKINKENSEIKGKNKKRKKLNLVIQEIKVIMNLR